MKYLRLLWPFLRPDLAGFVVVLLLMPIVTGLGVVQPVLLKAALDEHIVVGVADGLATLAWSYLAAVVGAFLVNGVLAVVLAWAAEGTIYRIRMAICRQVVSLSQRFYEGQPTGQILSRATSDVDALSEALTMGSVMLVLDLMNMIAVLSAMFLLDAQLTLVLLLTAPLLVGVIDFIRRRMRTLFNEIRDALAALNALMAERVAGVEILQVYRQEERTAERFRLLNLRYRNANVKNNWYDASLYAFIDGIASVCLGLILGAGAWTLAGAEAGLTVGVVVAFTDYIERLFRPLREFSAKVAFLQRAASALEKIFWLLAVDERIGAGDTHLDDVSGRLELKDVRFRYRPDAPYVLDGVSLVVNPGEVVALVGRTGSGKSTVVRLLGRVHDGYEGSILVDGVEISRLAPAGIRRAVGLVQQDAQLFADTIRFNLTLGDPEIDEARLQAAVQLSNLHVVAARREKGLDHVIRERGGDLSAGEAQIVALARTLARDPAVMILDEATASIDPLTEQLLQEALDRVFTRRTCLVVAHRLSTVTRADRILVMDGGRIVESGSHAELLAAGGAYAALHAEGFGDPARAAG